MNACSSILLTDGTPIPGSRGEKYQGGNILASDAGPLAKMAKRVWSFHRTLLRTPTYFQRSECKRGLQRHAFCCFSALHMLLLLLCFKQDDVSSRTNVNTHESVRHFLGFAHSWNQSSERDCRYIEAIHFTLNEYISSLNYS